MQPRTVVLALMLTLGLGSIRPVLSQTDTSHLTDADKLYGLSLFWKEVSYNFAFFDQVPNLNWDSAYQAYIPRVLAAGSTYEYYRELQSFCALLHDGHTSVNFPSQIRGQLSYPKLLLAEIDHRAYVRNVDSGLAPDIPIGTEIIAINDTPAETFVREQVMPYVSKSTEHTLWDWSVRTALRGFRGTNVTLTMRRPGGEEFTRSLRRDREGIRWYRPLPDRPLSHFEWLEDGIAYVQLNSFNDTSIVGEFEAVLPELYLARGLIIDLRNNPGGNSNNGTAILQHFTTDTLRGSTWRTPKHIAAFKAWGRHYFRGGEESEMVDYYLGNAWHEGDDWFVVPDSGQKIEVPVVVLFGRNTGSAAEDFLVFADRLEHFVYVGEPSDGSTGQPLMLDDLPGGGSARICSKRDTYPDGRDFVGVGIQPDIHVAATLRDLMEGSDTVLETGLRELKARLRQR